MHLVTLLCSMDTGPITTLEFIRLAGHQSFKTMHPSISYIGLESFVVPFSHVHCWSFATSVSKSHRALAASTKATEAAPVPLCHLRTLSTSLGKEPQSPYEQI